MELEIRHYLDMMDDLRGQVSELIRDLPAEALNWRPIEGAAAESGTNSLAALASHIAGAEHYWIAEVIGGQEGTRDRPAEFATRATAAAELVQGLADVGDASRTVLSRLTASDLAASREAKGRNVPVRWAILHVIDHTAIHLGHMQLTYQLWMSGQSGPSPRWYERLSPSN
jgi:uncharacterized damage-inducible protein DinB